MTLILDAAHTWAHKMPGRAGFFTAQPPIPGDVYVLSRHQLTAMSPATGKAVSKRDAKQLLTRITKLQQKTVGVKRRNAALKNGFGSYKARVRSCDPQSMNSVAVQRV